MRKFNEICKELDDKEAQKLLEESYNDVVAMRAVLVNKIRKRCVRITFYLKHLQM